LKGFREGELGGVADAKRDRGEIEVGIAQKTSGDGHSPVGEIGMGRLADSSGEAVREG